MVSTRHQHAEKQTQQQRVRNITLAGVALLVILATLSGGIMTAVGAAHQVEGLWARTFGSPQPTVGDHAAATWDTIKEWASTSGQVLPEPTLFQRAQSLVTRKPVLQLQTEELWARTQDTAARQANQARDAAGGYMDEAKRRALPAPTLLQRAKSWTSGKPIEQVQAEALYGDLKNNAAGYARDYAAVGQRKAGEAYDGAKDAAGNYIGQAQDKYYEATEESTWDKLKRLATGRSRAQVHYDAAKDRANDATGHLTEAAKAAYEATKAAGGAAASGAAAAWHSEAADQATQKTKDAAASAYDTAKVHAGKAGDVAADYAAAGQVKAGQAYDASKDAAYNAAGHAANNAKWAADNAGQAARDAYNDGVEGAQQRAGDAAQGIRNAANDASTQAGLTAEKARHRAEEYAQELKHAAQEKLHAARAEL